MSQPEKKPTPHEVGAAMFAQALRNQRNSNADECVQLAAELAKVTAERDAALDMVAAQKAAIDKLMAPSAAPAATPAAAS